MDNSYITVFLNSSIAQGEFISFMMLLILFLGRMLPIIALSPFFGARVLPHPVKVALGIALFAIFAPQLLLVTKTQTIGFNTWALVLFIKEVFIGYILGFFISLPFQIVQSSGIFIDHQRGGASLMINDPTIQNQSSPLGTMFNMVMIYIFFYIDGPFLFIDAILNSYEVIPPDGFVSHFFFSEDSSFWELEIQLLNQIMKIAIRLASPALIAILMTDLFLGIVNRMAPQVQITFLGLPLKSLLGLGVLTLGWAAFTKQEAIEGFFWIDQIERILVMFREGTLPE